MSDEKKEKIFIDGLYFKVKNGRFNEYIAVSVDTKKHIPFIKKTASNNILAFFIKNSKKGSLYPELANFRDSQSQERDNSFQPEEKYVSGFFVKKLTGEYGDYYFALIFDAESYSQWLNKNTKDNYVNFEIRESAKGNLFAVRAYSQNTENDSPAKNNNSDNSQGQHENCDEISAKLIPDTPQPIDLTPSDGTDDLPF